jgi:hypothetical protein
MIDRLPSTDMNGPAIATLDNWSLSAGAGAVFCYSLVVTKVTQNRFSFD